METRPVLEPSCSEKSDKLGQLDIRAYIIGCIHKNSRYVINHPWFYFNGGSAKCIHVVAFSVIDWDLNQTQVEFESSS